MSITGTPRFNGLAVGSLMADFTKGTIVVEATAGFVNSETGETHGWTKGEGATWSPDTMKKLQVLREAMEHDLAKMHFKEHSVQSNSESASSGFELEDKGLSEHLGVDAPSV
jgi:hypothetical protein